MNTRKKHLILLVVIYLAFISLGLPDGVLGVAWPAIRAELGLPLENMGIITTFLLCMSACSSFLSGFLIQKLGTAKLTFISGAMTCAALFGFSLSANFVWLLVLTIPLGFGQGAVDSGLNLYVSEHYTARHMNWLHCFWGVGASLGPMIMTFSLTSTSWRNGYWIVSLVQFGLSAILFVSLFGKLWKDGQSNDGTQNSTNGQFQSAGLFRVSDQVLAVLLFFVYSGIEFSIGIWLNSVLVESRGIPVHIAGLCATSFYFAIMIGRFLSGIFVNRLGNMWLIRLGLLFAAAGGAVIGISSAPISSLVGAVMIGLGLAPVFPCLIHETPHRFTKPVNDKLIGYQVGAAGLGGSLISAGTGVLLSRISLELLFPLVLLELVAASAINELLNRRASQNMMKRKEQLNELSMD